MQCEQVHEASSARLDGEPVNDGHLDAHLGACVECQQWLTVAHEVTRRTRLLPVPQVPDLSERIVAAVDADRQLRRRSSPRLTQVALVAVATLQLGLGLRLLLSAATADPDAGLHASHEIGSFVVALALAYLTAGLQPFRAGGLLPFAGMASVLLAVTAGVDLAGHR